MPEIKDNHLTQPEHWQEWFQRCAIDLCGQETRAALGRFAALRYRALVAYVKSLPEADLTERQRDFLLDLNNVNATFFWREMETAFWFKKRRSTGPADAGERDGAGMQASKIHKKFAETKAAGLSSKTKALKYLEGRATQSVWDHESWLGRGQHRRQLPPRRSDGEEPSDPIQHIPDPGLTPEAQQSATTAASGLLERLNDQERVLLLGQLQGRKIYEDADILRFLGVSKSQSYIRLNALMHKAREILRDHHLDTRQEQLAALGHLHDLLKIWAKPENSPGHFLVMEETA